MSIRKIIGMENNVEDFKVLVAPKSIMIPKNSKSFRLYLEKGMQIIGCFENDPNLSLKQSFYRFRQVHSVQFRITNLNHSNYTWSLYIVNPETMEQTFLDSATFKIQRTIQLYQMELLEKQRQIQTSFRQKTITKAMILQLWDKIKKQMKTCKSTQKCVFSNQQYQIEFQIQIRNMLDFETEKLAGEGQHRPLRRQKSDEFSSNKGSEVKNRQQNNSQVKQKFNQKSNNIQIQFTPYKSKKNKADEINNKQTTQLQPDAYSNYMNKANNSQSGNNQGDLENFNATVKIVDPKGELVDEKQQQLNENARKRSYSDSSGGSKQQHPLQIPTEQKYQKKFSLLSDIIEMSYEGSSSYGHPDHSSSNGLKLGTLRKDRTLDCVIENQMPDQAHAFNKVKTLPQESRHHHLLQVRNQFRRARTAEKDQKDLENSSLFEEQSYINVRQSNESQKKDKFKPSSGDPYGKWIILVAIIIIIGTISGSLVGEDGASKSFKKKTKQKKIAN